MLFKIQGLTGFDKNQSYELFSIYLEFEDVAFYNFFVKGGVKVRRVAVENCDTWFIK
jgi:hypothetical protein